MRVSLICKAIKPCGAVSASVLDQVRYFLQRGDAVRIYVEERPDHLSQDVAQHVCVTSLADLLRGHTADSAAFSMSDLYIYHYDGRYGLIDSIRGIDHGAVIVHPHHVIPSLLWNRQPDIQRCRRDFEGLSIVHYADHCMADSPYDVELMAQHFKCNADNVLLLPARTYPEMCRSNAENALPDGGFDLEGGPVILYAGELTPNAQVEVLIDAFAEVQQSLPFARLILCSNGDDAAPETVADVQALLAKQRLADAVFVETDPSHLPRYYQRADVYCSAHLNDGNCAGLIQALACDIPCVATRAGAHAWVLGAGSEEGLGEGLHEHGVLCAPGDARGLAKQLLRLLTDDACRTKVVEHGHVRAQSFNAQAYQHRLDEMVAQVVPYTLPLSGLSITHARAAQPNPMDATPPVQRHVEPQKDMLLPDMAALTALISAQKTLEQQADVAMRGYKVSSRIPVVGPLIAWVRRNVTSHLREPYLDIIIERQVAFNQQSAAWMQQVTELISAMLRERSRAVEDHHTDKREQ